MINLLYIAALIFAIAFCVLVVYLVKVLKETERTMGNVANTLEGLESQMEGITTETTILLNHTNALAEDINQKSQQLNGLVDSISGLGTTVTRFNQSLQQASDSVTGIAFANKEETAQIIRWGTIIIELLNKKKAKKNIKL